jgi:uncharacterized protein (TIGR03435 family)
MKTVLLFLSVVAVVEAFAQSGPPNPSFEAASIRTIDPGPRREKTIEDEPGRLTMRSVTLRDCISWAYEIGPVQLSGPSWLGDTRYDITGKAPEPGDTKQLRLMLRDLLGERFGLKLHNEQRVLAVYSMTLSSTGAKFHKPGARDASKFLQSQGDGPLVLGGDKTGLIAERVTMPEIATEISQLLQKPVIDKTGLKGKYDIRIDVTAFMTTAGDGDNHGPIDELSVIFSALPAQLGLKLEPGKEAVDFLVVDSANRVPNRN